MVGNMKHTGTSVIFISPFKIKAGIDSHIGSRNFDILVVRDVYAGRIVHLVVSARCNRETRYSTLSMIEYSINIWREYALIIVIDSYGRISPP